ncbi:hypothetical protein [Rickettsia endosymbiont of Halotydeus destructor]|uniref:hypothetical protein n=1 Tax=Rickettsia endosymbiont of Halotydeus destructor TaxID=2996754 RepID=UPI003BB1A21F
MIRWLVGLIKYIRKPKLAGQKIIQGGKVVKKYTVQGWSNLKSNAVNITEEIRGASHAVKEIMNPVSKATKTAEGLQKSVTTRTQNFDDDISKIINELKETQKLLDKKINASTDKPHSPNIEPFSPPNTKSVVSSAANNKKLANLQVVNTPEKTVANQGKKTIFSKEKHK